MNKRTWPLGTVKDVRVIDRIDSPANGRRISSLLCVVKGKPEEAYVCIDVAEAVQGGKGDEGTITFVHGGPFGAYW